MADVSKLRETLLKRKAAKCETAYGMLTRAQRMHEQRGNWQKAAQLVGLMDQAQAEMQEAQTALQIFYRTRQEQTQ